MDGEKDSGSRLADAGGIHLGVLDAST